METPGTQELGLNDFQRQRKRRLAEENEIKLGMSLGRYGSPQVQCEVNSQKIRVPEYALTETGLYNDLTN